MNHNNRGKRRANPLPSTIKRGRELAGLTQAQAAALLFTSARVWAQWESETATVSHRRMHPAFWLLFLMRTGLDKHTEFDPDLD